MSAFIMFSRKLGLTLLLLTAAAADASLPAAADPGDGADARCAMNCFRHASEELERS